MSDEFKKYLSTHPRPKAENDCANKARVGIPSLHNLLRRRADWTSTMASKNPESSKKQQRKENGGYHRPGSNSK